MTSVTRDQNTQSECRYLHNEIATILDVNPPFHTHYPRLGKVDIIFYYPAHISHCNNYNKKNWGFSKYIKNWIFRKEFLFL